ncbi:peptidylprolyl isomerase [Sanguibacter gelidistatuariae]|uniref:Peptidyl-prolyl cis-trans isomerase n=1 Tax=Sanguibacter gelidistatuariae TaxID=1814289 RepID=A0A1G6VH72_9MICO|nr:FKBP-type peptidyl-prolyl cis-trans isomerase [Sanguibacter gelidistatuariae]SDD52889.1 peptidylprolyl isomerase [Sanguibacter gelidistatuariae]
MKNRTVRAITALTLGGALLLSACGADAQDSDATPSASESSTIAPPTAADIAALAAVTWSGEAGEKPTIGFTPPFAVTADVSRVFAEGTGDATGVDGIVWVRAVMINGTTGEEAPAAASSWDAPQMIDLSTAPEGHALLAVLKDKKVGTQALYAAPLPQDDGTSITALTALEIIATPPAISLSEGMPTATFDESGAPSITVQPGFSGPADLITQVLSEGDGPVVEAGQSVTVNYSGWLQSTGEKFDSSWDRGTTFDVSPVGSAAVIDGWNQGLVGQKVGSKVMLVIPPELGYGAQGKDPIPGDATLVFVVEIIAAK